MAVGTRSVCDPPRAPTSHELYAHQDAMCFADLDTERGREEMQRHVKTCPICRANAVKAVAAWDAASAARRESTRGESTNGRGGL